MIIVLLYLLRTVGISLGVGYKKLLVPVAFLVIPLLGTYCLRLQEEILELEKEAYVEVK